MGTIKKKRNVVTLPDNFCDAIDNIKDNVLIFNRTDVLKHLIIDYNAHHPEKNIFKQKQKPIITQQTPNKDTPLVFISEYEIAPTGRVCTCGHQQHKHVKGKTVCYPGEGLNCDCKLFTEAQS